MLLAPAEAAATAERWSSIADLGGGTCPLLAVDLRGATRHSMGPETHDAFGTALHTLPWVNLAVVDDEPDPSLNALIDAFDIALAQGGYGATTVVVDDLDAEVQALHTAISASPQASVALVQLLRLCEHATVEQALHGESLTYAVLQTGETFRSWLQQRSATARPAVEAQTLETETSESGASQPVVDVERTGGLLTISLNRPDRRNALNIAMRDQLAEALELLDLDRTLDGAVLRGNGPNFSAGGDLDEFGSTPSPAVGHHVRTVRSLPRLVHRVRDRLRVHVHGSCVGAGIELPAFAHAVIADPATTFRLPEIGFGLVPGAGGTVSVSRRCGRQRTAWWAIRGTELEATTARAWGLIDRIAPAS
jgi:enoyl-CoA hydratase/carnithine racemase